MEKVNLLENEYALMCICECIGSDRDNDIYEIAENASDLAIELKINGKDLNFLKFLECIKNSYETAVENKAKEILKQQFEEIEGKAIDILDTLTYIHVDLDSRI